MSKDWNEYTKDELLALSVRQSDVTSFYDAVLFIPTAMQHESGFNLFAIVGCRKCKPVEIVGYMDDFRYFSLLIDKKPPCLSFAFDCSMNGVFRMHTEVCKIKIELNGSTTLFSFEEEKEDEQYIKASFNRSLV